MIYSIVSRANSRQKNRIYNQRTESYNNSCKNYIDQLKKKNKTSYLSL